MTREKEIKEAAYNHKVESINGELFYDNYDSFIEGAEWADKHPDVSLLWHDKTEMPDCGSTFIAIDNDNNICDCITESSIESELIWRGFVSLRNIKKWLYITDVLPKGGEK